MKKFIRIIAAVLVVASLLSISAFAKPGDGMNAFEEIANMNTYTFSDLVSNHWAYSGIKICYDRGILIGYPDGTFHPEENITWSQAVTIAARVHSAYHGNNFDATQKPGEYWYTPYYRYCSSNKLLPTGCPKLSALDSRDIQRYDLAYIFSRLIDAEDMPAISNRSIPDEGEIPSYYAKSVKTMYSAGIMNGMDNNEFSGDDYATRAQIATVVSRLLIPSERQGYDSKANHAMEAFQANLENDSVAVQLGSKYYCIYKYYSDPQTQQFALFLTDGNDHCKELYTCSSGEYLNNISVYKNKVYFCKSTSGTASGALLCYDPLTESVSTVYSGNIVEAYCFYNGTIYALLYTTHADKVDGYRYDFGTISGGRFSAITKGYTYYEVSHFQPYGWNGKIYFKLSSKDGPTNLYAYDIETANISKVLDVNINTSLFDGHVMYFLAFDNEGNYDCNLYAVSVQTPGVIYRAGEFPTATAKKYRSLYKYEDTVYCLSSLNRNIYSMDKSGNTRIALMCGGVYNALCFTKDKAILIPNTLAVDNPNELKVYSAGTLAARALYGDWIGLSCYYEGARFTTDEGQAKYVSTESVSTVSKLSITIPEAFHRGNDFIIRAKYTNNLDGDIRLRSYIVSVAVNGQVVAYDVNRLSGYEMRQYDIQTFTFVIGKDDILHDFDVAKDNISIEIIPTFDVIANPS